IMEKKEAARTSPPLPSRSEPQASLFPTDDHSSCDSVRQPLAKENRRELREKARKHHEKNWLAPAGSAREKQLLRSFAERGGLSQKDLAFIKEWINHSDEFAKRNALFWHAAKKSMLGSVVYETARERHSTLGDKEWLIAYFTVVGMGQKAIARLPHVGERTADQS